MSERAGISGTHYSSISAADSSRQHNGNVYNMTYNQPNLNFAQARAHGLTAEEVRIINEEQQRLERSWRENLLGWLTFAEINDRRERVHDAHQKTFRWILTEGHEAGLADWLQFGRGIYWISGKPASGKSTLMKFITHEKRLKQLLRTWSPKPPPEPKLKPIPELKLMPKPESCVPDTLVMGSFWFWAAGSRLQRSLVGLYRTLLYQILRADQSLCRIAFPEWQHRFVGAEPTAETLTMAMRNLLACENITTKYFFMIDGLDEYEKDSIGKTQLASLMLDLVQSPNVKLLLSSRPETPFEVGFRECRGLILEALTKPDVLAYIDGRLWSSPSTQDMDLDERKEIQKVANFIGENAKGVFLWVALVLDITLDGINSLEDAEMIRDRITQLPPELDDLFTHILMHRIPLHHRIEAFRYLLIVSSWYTEKIPGRIPITAVAVGRQISSYEQACELASLKDNRVKAIMHNSAGRINSRCHGLLECNAVYSNVPDDTVTFLHRTMLDFLQQQEWTRDLLVSHAGAGFDVDVAIIAGLAAYFGKAGSVHHDAAHWRATIEGLFLFNAKAEKTTGRHQSELIAAADRQIACLYKDGGEGMNGRVEGHWTRNMVRPDVKQDTDLLAYTIYTGAAFYLEQSLRQNEGLVSKCGNQLIHHALLPEAAEGQETIFPTLNIAAARLLIENGLDPIRGMNGSSPWSRILDRLIKSLRFPDQQPTVLKLLQLLVLCANYAPDLIRCRTMVIDDYTASQVVREILFKKRCCLGQPLEHCTCDRARSMRLLALELLQRIEPRLVGSMSFDPAKTKSFGRFDPRRMLLSHNQKRNPTWPGQAVKTDGRASKE